MHTRLVHMLMFVPVVPKTFGMVQATRFRPDQRSKFSMIEAMHSVMLTRQGVLVCRMQY
jgi:hypothetical protein